MASFPSVFLIIQVVGRSYGRLRLQQFQCRNIRHCGLVTEHSEITGNLLAVRDRIRKCGDLNPNKCHGDSRFKIVDSLQAPQCKELK